MMEGGEVYECIRRKRRFFDLEKLCLDNIVENFGMHNKEFKSPSSRVPKKNWEFLARRFSENLFVGLALQGNLKEEYLDFLFNPHLKVLDLTVLSKYPPPPCTQDTGAPLRKAIAKKVKIHGSNIVVLKASRLRRDRPSRSILCNLPNVQKIEFQDWVPTSLIKTIAKKCPLLESLTVHELYSVHEGDEYGCISSVLKHCQHLEIFLDVDIVGALYKMHTETSFMKRITKSGVSHKSEQYLLKTLTSRKTNYPLCDALKVCASVCPFVSTIEIYLQNTEELEACLLFPLLTDLRIKKIRFPTSDFLSKFLTLHGRKLTSLHLPCVNNLSLFDLAESCPNLEELVIKEFQHYPSDKDAELLRKTRLNSLKALTLECSMQPWFSKSFTGETSDLRFILCAAENVRSLNLKYWGGLTNDFMSSLDLRRIQNLDVSYSDIRIEALMQLVLHGSLQKLNIDWCNYLTSLDYFALSTCRPNGRNKVLDITWTETERPGVRCVVLFTEDTIWD